MPKLRKDTYRFYFSDVDMFLDASGGDDNIALGYAIDAARERTRVYVMPCTWTAEFNVDRSEIIVNRIRYA